MPSLYLLIPIALLFVGLAALLYWWAVRSGQYRDLDREADRILYEKPVTTNTPSQIKNSHEPEHHER